MQKPFRPRKDPRPDIEKALDRAIELSTAKKRYTISDGRLIQEEPRRYRYVFTLASSWDVPDDADLQLSSSDFDPPLSVQLLGTEEDTITLMVAQRLPERTVASAQLIIDRAYLFRKMKDALNPLTSLTTPAQLGLKLFSHLDCPDEVAPSSLVESISDVFMPDEAQRLAIQRALASELLMILGPPGTGKTDVLAAIAMLHAIMYKQRVLITSHTNIAIDNAIIRLAKFFRKHGMEYFLDEESLIRFGNPHLAELLTDDYRHITAPLIANDAVEHQREEIARLERMRDLARDQIIADEKELPQQLRAWEQRKAAIQRERQKAKADLADLENEEHVQVSPLVEQRALFLKQDEQAKQTMKQTVATWQTDETERQPLVLAYQDQQQQHQEADRKLKQLHIHTRVARFFVQLFTNEWEKDLDATVQTLTLSLSELVAQIHPIQQRQALAKKTYADAEQRRKDLESIIANWTKKRDAKLAFFQKEKDTVRQEIEDLDHELQTGNPQIADLKAKIEKKKQERALVENALAHLDQRVEEIKREAARKAVESAQIVGVTLTSLYLNPVLLNQEWDVVIIDEGSMAPPPAVLVAANHARSHLIIVGDPLQLAPVCKLKDPNVPPWQKEQDLVQQWLGNDVFFHGGYTLEEADTGTHHSVLLPYQSRMHSDICDLIRGPVYKGRLKDRDPHLMRPKYGPEREHPVVLYDTSGSRQAHAQQPTSKRSRYNLYHAEISVHLAHLALADFPEGDRKPECIGIVTPYAAQRDVIKDLVRGTELAIFSRIGTVHAFQGLEFAALVFDLVESPGLEIAPFLKGGWGSEAMRLMNVAVTRARHKLLIVANMEYLRAEPSRFILRQVTELACQKKCLPAEQLQIVRR